MTAKVEKFDPYEKRFGTIAIDKGYIDEDDLVEALSIQVQDNLEKGKHRLIGEILIEQGLMDYKEVDEVVTEVLNAKKNK